MVDSRSFHDDLEPALHASICLHGAAGKGRGVGGRGGGNDGGRDRRPGNLGHFFVTFGTRNSKPAARCQQDWLVRHGT